MPTYEFVCPDGHTFDKLYRNMSTAPSELACRVCGKVAVRKISGGAGLVFKGSGFYITDYGKDGKKGSSPPPSNKSDKSDTGAPKSESKSSDSSSSSTATPNPPPSPSSTKPKGSDSE